jgi:DNA-binding transcriptional LysR family regulator
MMRVFVAVAREGSFTRAAEQLGIAVQTASKAVRQLEANLNAQLCDRTTRSVTLNDTGRAYFERCLELLDQFDELDSAVSAEHSAPQGRIRMTAPTTFGERNLLPVLASYLSDYPNIRIDLNLSDRKIALVDEGYDLAIRIGELKDSTMISRKLAPMRVVVCASPEYLQQHGVPATPQDLGNHACVIDTNFASENHWPFLVDNKLQRVTVAGPFQANTPEATRQMALAGVGIAMCPMYVISADLVAGRLQALFEKQEAYNFAVYALYPQRRHLSARVRSLVDHLAVSFRQQ